jgi:hypothetical protein
LLGKPYRKKRRLGQKELLGAAVAHARANKNVVMIEWVKGHEKQEEVQGMNWVSKYKIQENQWADEEARKVVEEGVAEDIKGIQEWSLKDRDTGKVVRWGILAKMVQHKLNDLRKHRLSVPSKAIYQHGQGVYLRESLVNRLLAWKHVLGRWRNTVYHYNLVRYMMNKVVTGESRGRWAEEEGRMDEGYISCMPCFKKRRVDALQTKEHLWSGECCKTKPIWKGMADKLDEEIRKWKIPVTIREELVAIIRQEWAAVNTQHWDGELEQHKLGMGLIGIWKNTTLQRAVKLLTEKIAWTEENAMEKIRDLAMINLKSAAEIEKRLINIKKRNVHKNRRSRTANVEVDRRCRK